MTNTDRRTGGRMRVLTIVMLFLSAPSLFAETRVAKANATTPAEAVNWTAGVPYAYDGSGNITSIGNDAFTYDQVGRLDTAKINGVTRTYQYDAFGNRIACTHQPGTAEQSDCQFSMQIDSGTNRTMGVQHDGRGNVKTLGGHTYTYDETDMPKRDDGTLAREFIYTADGERIATYTVGGEWKWTLRDFGGQVVRELTSNGSTFTWQKDYVYRDGQLLASRHLLSATPVTYHYHLDHLGSPRRITDQNNRIVGFHDFLAFGPEVPGGLNEPMAAPFKYTGHERDRESSGIEGLGTLDYMHARYYSPALGRFLSTDPLLPDWAVQRPQGFHRYAYALNNPISYLDPFGLVTTCHVIRTTEQTPERVICSEVISVEARKPQVRTISGGLSSLWYLRQWAAGNLPRDIAASKASTEELANTPAMENIRDQYKKEGCRSQNNWSDFQVAEFMGTGNVTGHVVGGFTAKIRPIGNGMVIVHAQNTWGRASLTRIPGVGNRGNPSVQTLLSNPNYFMQAFAHTGQIPGTPSSLLDGVSSGFLADTTVHYSWIEGSPCMQ